MMRQSSEVPQIIENRICHLAESLPANQQQKQKILQKYSHIKGYQFLNPKSKLHKHFVHRCNAAKDLRSKRMQMQNEIKITMEGSLDQISVGAMCEIVKQNLRKGTDPYQPALGQLYQQQIIYERDEELFAKTVKLLHGIYSNIIGEKSEGAHPSQDLTLGPNRSTDLIQESRKQMTIKDDGSLGAWGGKKYEGLGSQNQFTNFRREQSMNYYQNSYFHSGDKKKP